MQAMTMMTSLLNHLSIDIETYSSADLSKCGVYRYVESDDFEILLFGYALNGSSVKVVDLAQGEKIPNEILQLLEDSTCIKSAFNAGFERVCLSKYLGYKTGTYLNPESWRCDMVWSAYMGLPLSLKGVGTILALDKQKLEEGKDLIKYFCVPCAPTKANGQRTRNLPSHAPDKWETFKAYNKRDVETEIQIQEKLSKFPVPDSVWEEYAIDQRINDNGVHLDLALVDSAISMDAISRSELTNAMKKLTELDNPNSVIQIKQWLSDKGVEIESLGKKAVMELLSTVPEELKSVLVLRQQLSKSSVKKYQAMKNASCSDERARGMFQFYGANRTGRWAGRLIQLQNLPQNHLDDLSAARSLVKSGDFEAVKMLYGDVPDTLSQLIRTAFTPEKDKRFFVADFSAIEARVIAWYAGESWRMDLFANGGDIYCQSASEMFSVPVVKNGINGHLRQKGKIAELACIAEGSPVLTDRGLVPIEKVRLTDKVWDGENWVAHEGVIYKGEKGVIEYEGLTATPNHLVWVEGQSEPIQFGIAATSGAHLIQTGDGRTPVRLGKDYKLGEKMEQKHESLLCSDSMSRMRSDSVADIKQSAKRNFKGMPKLLANKTDSQMAGQTINVSKTKMRKSCGQKLQKLWCKGNSIRFCKCDRSWAVSDQRVWPSEARNGNRQNRHERKLCFRQSTVCKSQNELHKSAQMRPFRVFSGILALFLSGRNQKTVAGTDTGRNNIGCGNGCFREKKELENHQCTARLYDICNAGPHHRFTVSGCLVHNCGYGGSVGALKAMGALDMGLAEDELPGLVNAWRASNPKITDFWWDVDEAAIKAIRNRTKTTSHGLVFEYRSGMLFITLPSGRKLSYVKPKLVENQYGRESITYEGAGTAKKWDRIETYGPKLVENIVQATARDILCYAMKNLKGYKIVMHIHDEVVIEADKDTSLKEICALMGKTPEWAPGLLLRADGYVCDFYMKD